ncbi:MAG: PfkB family carbohydrate kinase [Candidatus Dormibacteria bacterium]
MGSPEGPPAGDAELRARLGARATDAVHGARRLGDQPGTLVVGSITQDFVDSPGAQLEGHLGGSATYFALAARHFGPVSVIGTVGAEREADLRRTLHFADLGQLTVSETGTYTWRARRTEPGGEAVTLERFEGAYAGYQPAIQMPDEWPRGIFLGSCAPEVQQAVLDQVPEGSLVGFDTMDVFIRTRRAEVLRLAGRSRFLVLTATELELLADARGIASAASLLLTRLPVTALVIKRGPAGAILWTREGGVRFEALPVAVVDPTGAGDAFAGAFMGHMMEHSDLSMAGLSEAVRWGLVMASFAIEAPGLTHLEGLSREDLERRLEDYLTLFPRAERT